MRNHQIHIIRLSVCLRACLPDPGLSPSHLQSINSCDLSSVLNFRLMGLFASEYLEFLSWSLALLATILTIFRWLFLHDKVMNLPPGPRRWPILGNLVECTGTHPHVDLMNLAEKYGPLMYLKLGQRDCIVASSPEMAKEVLKNQDANFCGRPHSLQVDIVIYKGQDISFQQPSSNWRYLRRILQLELTGLKRVEATKHVRREEMECMLSSIKQDVGLVDLRAQLTILMCNVISRMVLNKRYVGVSKGDNTVDKAKAQEFRESIEELSKLFGVLSIGDFIPVLAWLDLQGYAHRSRKLHKRMDAFITKIIAEHRAKRGNAPVLESEKDMVDVMLDEYEVQTSSDHFTETNMKGVILDVFTAGTDSMMLTSEWAMSETFRNPSIVKKALQELDIVVGRNRLVQESDLPHLKYIQCICKETLRLHPSAPLLLPHESIQACNASGFDVPAKTRLLVNVYAIGRDPKIWDDPLEFLPERFMEGSKYSKVSMNGQDFELLPFGSGRRMCPAMNMASVFVQLVVANLLHAFDWSLPNQMNPKDLDMSEMKGLTVARATPLHAMATPRLSHALYE